MRRIAVALALLALVRPAAVGAWELSVRAPPTLQTTAERLRGLDMDALERELQRAGLPLPVDTRVELVPEDDARARQTPRWIVGQAFPNGDVWIFPARVSAYPYDSLEAVLWHEVVHLALFTAAGGDRLPRWFHEGVAVSIETGWGTADSLRLLVAAARGPELADISRLFQASERSESAEAYRLATALVDSLRTRHGAAIPGAIAHRVAGGETFERAFVLEIGQTPDQAAAEAWAGYLTAARWLPVATHPDAVWTFILGLASLAFLVRLRRRRRKRWDDTTQ